MIDIESMVFDYVYNQLHESYPSVNISAGYDEHNAIFPTVVIRQTNSQPYRETATDPCAENHTRLTYEVEVFSDKANTGRSECKQLIIAADDIMQSIKFRRIHLNRPINVDRTIWRQYARYEVIVGKPYVVNEGTADEKTIYQMYRR